MPNIAILYQTTPTTPMVLEEKHLELIRSHNPDGEVRAFETEKELLAANFDAEILLTWGRIVPNDYCNSCTNLRWIHSISAGAEGLMKLDVAKPPMIITKMAEVHGRPMSDTTICYILSFLRCMPLAFQQQQDHNWDKTQAHLLDESYGKTVAIIGIGSIGSEIARKCKFFEMKVIGCRRTPNPMEYVDEMYPLTELPAVLEQADFVVSLVPDTPESEGMFNYKVFSQMKPSAIFINIGRGKVVNHADLVTALQEGLIAGAAIDAAEPEPLDADSPLWDMKNVIITPHWSADSPHFFDRATPLMCDNLDRFLKGEDLKHRVL